MHLGSVQVKSALNTLYFSADHVVWASQAGILTDKALVDRAQKLSLYSWLGASCCTIASEMSDILRAALPAVLVLSLAVPLSPAEASMLCACESALALHAQANSLRGSCPSF